MKISSLKNLWALGLMSGTSADGVDGALLQTDGKTITNFGATFYKAYPKELKQRILEAFGSPPAPEVKDLAQAITEHHAEVVTTLLERSPAPVDLIGFHGQTLFHRPPQTYQIGDGHLLAHLTGIPVIDQFRLNDVAHGGEGAPLVPVFHQALSENLPKPLAILNLGGVANLTWVGQEEGSLLAFDTGPGNGLIDDWIREKTDLPWDDQGKIGVRGHIHEQLLEKWLSHPYFSQKPPKSLDRLTFQGCLKDIQTLSIEDGAATLTAFTATSLKKALKYLPAKPLICVVTGGGVYNLTLIKKIEETLGANIKKASDMKWNNDFLEAQAFAFLAVRSFYNLPLSFPGTTGVSAPLTGGRLCQPHAFAALGKGESAAFK